MVLADDLIPRSRHLGASSPDRRGDYHARLEAYLRSITIHDPGGVADELTARFATLSELLSAEPAVIAHYAGPDTAFAMGQVRGLMVHAAAERLCARKPIRSQSEVAAFLKTLVGFRSDEALVVIFLDAARRVIDYEIVAVGRADTVEFDQRRILLQALGRGAMGIIVAHNHPSGDSTPSSSDFRSTRLLTDTAHALGIRVHDHLVIAGGEVRTAMLG